MYKETKVIEKTFDEEGRLVYEKTTCSGDLGTVEIRSFDHTPFDAAEVSHDEALHAAKKRIKDQDEFRGVVTAQLDAITLALKPGSLKIVFDKE